LHRQLAASALRLCRPRPAALHPAALCAAPVAPQFSQRQATWNRGIGEGGFNSQKTLVQDTRLPFGSFIQPGRAEPFADQPRLPGTPAPSENVQDILAQLRAAAKRFGLRVEESFVDFDRMRSRKLPADKFRMALRAAFERRLSLSEAQVQALISEYAAVPADTTETAAGSASSASLSGSTLRKGRSGSLGSGSLGSGSLGSFYGSAANSTAAIGGGGGGGQPGGGALLVRWRDFVDDVNEVFTLRHLETRPLSTPQALVTTWELVELPPAEMAKVERVLERFAREVRRRSLQLKPAMRDFERSSRSPMMTDRITQTQFHQALALSGLEMTNDEFKALCARYDTRRDGSVDYVQFVNQLGACCRSPAPSATAALLFLPPLPRPFAQRRPPARACLCCSMCIGPFARTSTHSTPPALSHHSLPTPRAQIRKRATRCASPPAAACARAAATTTRG
jgi:hypothetical protein